MSKAFTREDGPPEPPLSRPASEGRVRATPEGFQRLQRELAALREAEDAKGSPRLEYLARRLAQLDVIASPPESARDRVLFGAHVVLEDESGEERRYQLVGPEELDAAAGKVSFDSPLGRALQGRAVGDEVTVERPVGAVTYTVKEVRYGEQLTP